MDELRDALEDMVRQFACTTERDGVPCYWTGGLSALEYAFAVLGWDDPQPVSSVPMAPYVTAQNPDSQPLP